mmetsp:Transcript_13901/g.27456  ORF Transcript_13901/g.27456 Transcript_13901/m.27456 type:complete len:388 (-) Transcript_13901:77-1240(-)
MGGDKAGVAYELLELFDLPDDYYKPSTTLESILARVQTAGPSGFEANSLNTLEKVPMSCALERITGGIMYIALHIVPGWVGSFACCHVAARWMDMPDVASVAGWLLGGALTYFGGVYTVWRLVSVHHMREWGIDEPNLVSQRNTEKYFSMRAVWAKESSPLKMSQTPAIFCMVPHGLLPLASWIPLFNKVWSSKQFRWTAAPALFSLPIVSGFLRDAGVMPAKANHIRKALTEEKGSVGVVLDGVAGIFTGSHSSKKERVHLSNRKAIVAIALQAGVPIIPVYVYGHTGLYDVVVDPFGVLKYLSCHFNVALSPFFGRWGWPFGPPRRLPLLMAFGKPVEMPPNPQGVKPERDEVDQYHARLVASFTETFDAHKAAYGWPDTELVVQ